MSTWDDKPNDYEHACRMIDHLRAENERLRAERAGDQQRLFHCEPEIASLRANLRTSMAENDNLKRRIARLETNAAAPQPDNEWLILKVGPPKP
jgi:septal ring factor EnvC (AmiA/AmiB activator)